MSTPIRNDGVQFTQQCHVVLPGGTALMASQTRKRIGLPLAGTAQGSSAIPRTLTRSAGPSLLHPRAQTSGTRTAGRSATGMSDDPCPCPNVRPGGGHPCLACLTPAPPETLTLGMEVGRTMAALAPTRGTYGENRWTCAGVIKVLGVDGGFLSIHLFVFCSPSH